MGMVIAKGSERAKATNSRRFLPSMNHPYVAAVVSDDGRDTQPSALSLQATFSDKARLALFDVEE
jgi:hypothetical protein